MEERGKNRRGKSNHNVRTKASDSMTDSKTVKNPPAMQDTQVQYQRDDLLEEGMGIHSSILAWRTPWTEEPSGLQSMGLQELDMSEQLTLLH